MKYWYKIAFRAKEVSSGWVQLTEEHALAIRYALDTRNWVCPDFHSDSGHCYIDIEGKRKTKPKDA